MSTRQFYSGLLACAAIYCSWCVTLRPDLVGLHYDEALDAVPVVTAFYSEELSICTGPRYFAVADGCYPLMIAPYIGSLRSFLMLPFFGVFGVNTLAIRMSSAMCGCLAIVFIGIALRSAVGSMLALLASAALACHPSYITETLFDNSQVSTWMLTYSLCLVTLAFSRRSQGWLAASLAGLAVGLALWARINFAWLVIAGGIAILLTRRGELRAFPKKGWLGFATGTLIGLSPLIAYVIQGGAQELKGFYETSRLDASYSALIAYRSILIAESLTADGEGRAIWGGGLPTVVVVCSVVVWIGMIVLPMVTTRNIHSLRTRPVAPVLIALIVLTGIFELSRAPIAEHHIVAMVPIAIWVVAAAWYEGVAPKWIVKLGLTAAAVFCMICFWCNAGGAAGIRKTQGRGPWSRAIEDVVAVLRERHIREVKVLDWGLANQITVLTEASIKPQELFWGATPLTDGKGRPWEAVIQPRTAYLMNASGNQHFPAASKAFTEALLKAGTKFSRFDFREASGDLYASLVYTE